MRKLVLIVIATLSLGAFALAQSASGQNQASEMQAGNDWYNQTLAAQGQQFVRIAAATAPSKTALSEGGEQPGSMASNLGSEGSWYDQTLAAQVKEFSLIKAAIAPSSTESAE